MNLVEVNVTPELTHGESPDPRTELPPMVEEALTHLLDPSKPEDGHNVALPVAAEKQDVCSDPAPVNVPLRRVEGKYKARRVTVKAESSTRGPSPIVSESALKLVCLPAEQN